jgi:hypothetical protein
MKLKSAFIAVCLLIGGLLFQLSAQNSNRAYTGWGEGEWWTPVFCDGEQIDILNGTVTFHWVYKPKDGGMDIDHAHGTLVSEETGEVFKYNESSKFYWGDLICAWHYHAIGENGTVYHGIIVADMLYPGSNCHDWILTPGKTVCH